MGTDIKQQNKVPKLRFSGFDDVWDIRRIGDIFDNIGGTALENFTDRKSEHNFISIGNYSTDGKYIDNGQRIVLNEKTMTKLLDKDDLVMVLNDKTLSGELIGSTILIREDNKFIYNQRSERLTCKSGFSPYYAWQFLNSKKFRRSIVTIAQGGTQIYVNFPSVKKVTVVLPEIAEQQKIADFLNSIDAWLDNLRSQKTALEAYKRAMMQKLFSQQIRFKDDNGKDFPEWEDRTISNILKIGSGRDYKHLDEGNVPVYGTGGYMLSVNKALYSGETVCIGRKGTIDKPFYYNGDLWTVDTLFYTYDFQNVTAKFVYIIFQQINWKKYNEASGVPSLSKTTIEKIPVSVPNLTEQQKIADFLTSLDKGIELKQQQIAKAEEWKKGLMQKMFV